LSVSPTAAALLLQAGALVLLKGHRDVDAMIERILDAIRGGEGLDRWDLERLQRWCRRWSQVHPEVRQFYRRALASQLELEDGDAVVAGVRCLLDGVPSLPSTRGRLSRLHVDLMAVAAGRDLTSL
jgi:hypothetical protein